MDYSYPNIVKGATGTETVTVQVHKAKAETALAGPVRITIGLPLTGAYLPKLFPVDATARKGFFLDVNTHRDVNRDAQLVAWPFCPAVNLYDDDALIENLPAIQDQAKTARSFAPEAVLRIAPLTFNSPYPRPSRDPRNLQPFASAWLASAIRHVALGGVAEAMLDVGPAYADLLRRRLAGYAGSSVLATTGDATPRSPIEALAIQKGETTLVWLANLSALPQRDVELILPGAQWVVMARINEKTQPDMSLPTKKSSAAESRIHLYLAPYEVCEIMVLKK